MRLFVKSYLLLIGLPISGMVLHAAKDRAWQEGRLTDVMRTTENEERAFGGIGKTVLFSYTVEVGDRFYVGARAATFTGGPPVDLDINTKVKVAIEGKDFYLQDKRGKEYRVRIIKQGLKNPS